MSGEKKEIIYSKINVDNLRKSSNSIISPYKKTGDHFSRDYSDIANGSGIDFYKNKNDSLIKRIKELEEEVKRLIEENNFIKSNNINYCRQINEYEQSRNGKIEKIEINLNDLMHLSETNQIKTLISRLTNNYNRIEKEQKDLIAYLNIVTVDFLNVKAKVKKADEIVDSLKKMGQDNIENVMKKMKEIMTKNEEMHKTIVKLQKEKNLIDDKHDIQEKKYVELADSFHRLSQKYDDLNKKHKILSEEYNEKKNVDKFSIYELETKNQHLEDELREFQSRFYTSNKEQEEHRMKLKELEKENENLKTTFNSTFHSQLKDEGFNMSSPLKNSNKLKKSKSNFGMNKSHTSKK